MSSIGNVLKEARNKKSLSLEDVHSRIKIHPRVIQLLEEDKFDKLPSPVFVKSFLKSYAELLDVNPEEIVRAYDKEGRKDPAQVLFIKPAAEREKRTILDFDMSILVLPAILLALIIGGVALFSLAKTAASHIKEKKSSVAISKTLKTTRSEVAGRIKSAKAEDEKASLDKSFIAENWLRHPELGNFPRLGKKDALHLKIKAADSVWLRVTCDGKVLFQSILKRGATETWSADEQFELWTGNASSMELSLNNFDIGSPGKGVTKKMLIGREGVRIAS